MDWRIGKRRTGVETGGEEGMGGKGPLFVLAPSHVKHGAGTFQTAHRHSTKPINMLTKRARLYVCYSALVQISPLTLQLKCFTTNSLSSD